jgi:hypothetical protein
MKNNVDHHFFSNDDIRFNYGYRLRNVTLLIAMYPAPHVVRGNFKRSSSTVVVPVEDRVLSQERLQNESVSSHSSLSFTFPPPSQQIPPESIEVEKRQRDTTEFYENSEKDDENVKIIRKSHYNLNAPRYKPQIPRGDTQLVLDEDDYSEVEDKVKEKDIVKDIPDSKSKQASIIPPVFTGSQLA